MAGIENLGENIRVARKARDLSQEAVARRANLSLNVVARIELGIITNPHYSTLSAIASALDTSVAELVGEKQPEVSTTGKVSAPPKPGPTEAEEQAAEPLSPKQRRFAASARIATLERTFQHLTLRIETLRNQGKKYLEAGDRKDLWPVFMDSVLLTRGAEALLAETREEAEELGGETAEERRLRDRLEHRIEDVDEARGEISDMWKKLRDAENEAESEAWRKEERHPEAEPPDLADVPNIFSRRERAG